MAGISAFAFLVLLKCLVVFQNRKIKAKRYIVIFVCMSISNIRILFNLRQIYKSFYNMYSFLLIFFLCEPHWLLLSFGASRTGFFYPSVRAALAFILRHILGCASSPTSLILRSSYTIKVLLVVAYFCFQPQRYSTKWTGYVR